MEILTFRNTYWNYYIQMENDFFSYSPYCEIDACNDNTFSVKYLQLHLSVCGEIDTICKTLCKLLDDSLDLKKCGFCEYIPILKQAYPTFSQEVVNVSNYNYRDVQPWKSIEYGHIPNWWNVYNDLKHHRDDTKNNKENYKYANQKNIVEALCALYTLIEYWAAKNFAEDESETMNKIMYSFCSKKLSLKKWRPFYQTFMGQTPWFNTKSFFAYIDRR